MTTHDPISFDLFATNADAISRRRRTYAKAKLRTITTRAGRRTVKQRLRAMLPRLDLGGMA